MKKILGLLIVALTFTLALPTTSGAEEEADYSTKYTVESFQSYLDSKAKYLPAGTVSDATIFRNLDGEQRQYIVDIVNNPEEIATILDGMASLGEDSSKILTNGVTVSAESSEKGYTLPGGSVTEKVATQDTIGIQSTGTRTISGSARASLFGFDLITLREEVRYEYSGKKITKILYHDSFVTNNTPFTITKKSSAWIESGYRAVGVGTFTATWGVKGIQMTKWAKVTVWGYHYGKGGQRLEKSS